MLELLLELRKTTENSIEMAKQQLSQSYSEDKYSETRGQIAAYESTLEEINSIIAENFDEVDGGDLTTDLTKEVSGNESDG